MKSKEEILELNVHQKAYYNKDDEAKKLNFFSSLWRSFRNGPLNSFQKEYALRARMYALHKEWLGDLSTKKVLDLGCFRGNALSLYLAENAMQYVGIDLSDVAIADLQKKIEARACQNAQAIALDFLSDNFLETDFDVIYAFGVLHHFENFDLLMKRLIEKLKPGGAVISFDPLETSPPVRFLRKLYRPFQQDKDWEWPFGAKTFEKIQDYFEISELRGVLGKSKYGLLLHFMPFSKTFKKKHIEQMIQADWRNQSPMEVLNCMQVTMHLKAKVD